MRLCVPEGGRATDRGASWMRPPRLPGRHFVHAVSGKRQKAALGRNYFLGWAVVPASVAVGISAYLNYRTILAHGEARFGTYKVLIYCSVFA